MSFQLRQSLQQIWDDTVLMYVEPIVEEMRGLWESYTTQKSV